MVSILSSAGPTYHCDQSSGVGVLARLCPTRTNTPLPEPMRPASKWDYRKTATRGPLFNFDRSGAARVERRFVRDKGRALIGEPVSDYPLYKAQLPIGNHRPISAFQIADCPQDRKIPTRSTLQSIRLCCKRHGLHGLLENVTAPLVSQHDSREGHPRDASSLCRRRPASKR